MKTDNLNPQMSQESNPRSHTSDPTPHNSDPTSHTSYPTPDSSSFFSKILKGDKVIWSVFIILCVISLVEVFSATSTIVYRQQNHWGHILRHASFMLGGVGVILFMHNVPYKYFSSLIFLLLISIVLLLLTPIIGTSVNGADRWISIMGMTTVTSTTRVAPKPRANSLRMDESNNMGAKEKGQL